MHKCVPVFCKLEKLFPHLLWLATKTLQPWGSHPPHTAHACTSSFSDYLGSHWQSIVCYTDMLFVYRGSLLNLKTTLNNKHPYCGATDCTLLELGCFFLLDSRLERHSGSLSKSWHLSVCVYCVLTFYAVVCVYFPDTTPRHGSPVWLTLQRTSDSNSRARCRAR